ncbi:arginine deiminase [Aminipila luticellarii]|uniref:Arginine deiminase n=1 Tax=Aminipila luticellarii TaxID=2507160 RepID=A0A410PUL9_9FIRM|nr:arginine deiminase [Aminipila luticellarii]QAT42642.1 arginine deiminase [Aminipila luticellarii]
MVINVKSEIRPLKKVLLHRPGKELENLTPDTLDRLLFDDIPFLEVAQAEHDAFAQILRDNGVEVVYLEDLMADVLNLSDEIRDQFLYQWIKEAGVSTRKQTEKIYQFMLRHNDNKKEMVLKSMEGIVLRELGWKPANASTDSLVDLMNTPDKLIIDPMPNLYFTRDPFACIGNGVSVNRMYSQTRNRETIYGEYIFKYHPDYKDKVDMLYNRYEQYHVEGGDILNLNDKVLAVGVSQRTEPAAVEVLAKNIFSNKNAVIDTILAFDIPVSRAFMHLDTVFTQIDVDKFTVHPGILGPLVVYEIKRGEGSDELAVKKIEEKLETILEKYLGIDKITLIKCGGEDLIAAQREQWNDGSNTLCIAPGKIVTYQRNTVTNKLLREYNVNVLEVPSAELSRGRGGPRCMSMPLVRE